MALKTTLSVPDGRDEVWKEGNSTRPLTLAERMLAVAHTEGYWRCSGCTSFITPVERKTVLRAWETVCGRHALLHCRISREAEPPRFELIPEQFPLIGVVNPPYDIEDLLQVESGFDLSDPPFWSVRLLLAAPSHGGPDGDRMVAHMIHSIHHCIGDGVAHMGIIQEVLALLQSPEPTEVASSRQGQSRKITATTIPTIRIGRSPRFGDFVNLLRFASRYWALRPRRAWGFLNGLRRRGEGVKTNFVFRRLDPSVTQALYRQCRQSRTTVHGACCAAGIRSLLSVFPNLTGVVCSTSIDLRFCYEIDPDHSFFQCQGPVRHFRCLRRFGHDFWDLAYRSRHGLRRQSLLMPSLVRFEKVAEALSRFVDIKARFSAIRGRLSRSLGRPGMVGDGQLTFSNMGVHELPRLDALRIVVTDNECGGLFGHYFYVNNGALDLTITYPNPIVSAVDANRYGDLIIQELTDALSS